MKIKTTKQLGTSIRDRRQSLKITQKDLAMTSDTGIRFIIDVEKGKPTCQIGKILQLLQSLGMTVDVTWQRVAGYPMNDLV
jgi:y4mF family transcriptional regulator